MIDFIVRVTPIIYTLIFYKKGNYIAMRRYREAQRMKLTPRRPILLKNHGNHTKLYNFIYDE